ncbi:hypothetical protein ASG92_03835 [Arthrobacter sp. Soil736]|nr:hypothetical protein ASG92_03835 [Arthrobacter sp. Soil736]
MNQFRDNYGKQIIEIQLTNNSASTVTVRAAGIATPLFAAGIAWRASPDGTQIPPGQAKSLPAHLTTANCGTGTGAGSPGTEAQDLVSVTVRLSPNGAAENGAPESLPATDPFGVLVRNNTEQCLARDASSVAAIGLRPELDVSGDGRRAVLRLSIRPSARTSPEQQGGGSGAGRLVIERIDGTPLLAEDPARPWPLNLTIEAGGPAQELELGIRPARCDPHAVAEDKVGTVIPLRVMVGARTGILKVTADRDLRGRILDFVTAACARTTRLSP